MDPNNFREMRQMMQPGGIAEKLMQDKYEDEATGHTYSEAALIADVVNIMRLNTKQLGALHDVDINIQRMTEERAAQLLEEMARQDDMALVSVFEQIETKQDTIVQAVLDHDEYHDFLETKERAALSIPSEAVGQHREAEADADVAVEAPTGDAEAAETADPSDGAAEETNGADGESEP